MSQKEMMAIQQIAVGPWNVFKQVSNYDQPVQVVTQPPHGSPWLLLAGILAPAKC